MCFQIIFQFYPPVSAYGTYLAAFIWRPKTWPMRTRVPRANFTLMQTQLCFYYSVSDLITSNVSLMQADAQNIPEFTACLKNAHNYFNITQVKSGIGWKINMATLHVKIWLIYPLGLILCFFHLLWGFLYIWNQCFVCNSLPIEKQDIVNSETQKLRPAGCIYLIFSTWLGCWCLGL